MKLEDTAKKIESMEIRGAARIARLAAMALRDFALGYEGSEIEPFKDECKKQRKP